MKESRQYQKEDSAQRIFCLTDLTLVPKKVLYASGNSPPREEETQTRNHQNERKMLQPSLQYKIKQKAKRTKVHISLKYTYLLQEK
jgi:hypothetical protein